jgi:hypothetical protein
VGHLHTKIGEVSIIAQPNGGSFPQVLTFAPIKFYSDVLYNYNKPIRVDLHPFGP